MSRAERSPAQEARQQVRRDPAVLARARAPRARRARSAPRAPRARRRPPRAPGRALARPRAPALRRQIRQSTLHCTARTQGCYTPYLLNMVDGTVVGYFLSSVKTVTFYNFFYEI